MIAAMASSSIAQAIDVYVAPNGSDSNSGTASAPLQTLLGARNKVRTLAKNQQIRVFFRAGTYQFSQTVGFGSSDSGTSTNPVVYQSYPGETAFFDGGRVLDTSGFTKVTGSLEGRLATAAKGNAWSQVITDQGLIDLLSQQQNGITYNGFLFRPTQSPNNGYFNISQEFSNGAFQIAESTNFSLLASELNRTSQGEAFGYVRREFDPYTIPIKRFAGGGNSVVELDTGSSYLGFPGTPGSGVGPRVRFRNMLATMDIPREWYFDKSDSRLYLYPPGGNISSTDRIVVWGGEGAINSNGANHLYFHDFVFQNFATVDPVANRFNSVVFLNNGSNLRMRGCTLRHISIPLAPFTIAGGARNCLVDSCDLYDNGRGSRLRGGNISTGSIVTGNNRVSNCHFYRVDSKSLGTAVGIEGRGNFFTNNLVHNSSKQPITYFGYDNKIDLNEIYNVCQDEGDGGAIYTGARLYSHGNSLRRNLIHHNIGVPGLIPRAGIYFDDFDGGDTAEENIFFKAGAFALYSNKGTGNTAQRNIVIKSFSGVRSGGGGVPAYDTCMLYLNRVGGRTPTTAIKENYIGGMLSVCGKAGWESRVNSNNWRSEIDSFWTNRYPKFGRSMDAYFANKTMIPYETRLLDNYFAECTQNVQAPPGSIASNNRDFNLSAMVDPNGTLNFDWKSGQRPSGAVDTNSFDPGLETGTFRSSIPAPSSYRLKVAQKFSGIPSYVSGSSYNPNLANRNLYNSGRDVVADSLAGLGVKEGDAFKNPAPPEGSIIVDTSRTKYDYDFGTSTSPVQSGTWVRISPVTQGDVSWSGSVSAVDRGSGGVNDINRDLVYSSQSRVLRHKIANGTWNVKLNMGDKNFAHDTMRVRAEGTQVVRNNINSSVGSFPEVNFDVTVSDGQLNLEFSDQGGSDPNWVLTRLTLTRSTTSPPPPPPSALAGGDVGSAGLAGSTTDNGNDSFTLQGSGADIWGTADAFQFASESLTASTGTLVARIASVTNTNVWAKAGVHYRDSTAAGSMNVGVYVRPDGQVAMQWRASTNGASSWHGTLVGNTGFAKWVRITKNGDSYTGAWSTNGTAWTDIRTVTVSMGNDNLGGLALTSHNNGALATAEITNYSSNWSNTSPPPAEITPPTGLTQLEFRHSSKCVDNKGGTANGVEFHQWTCGVNPNRNFTFTALGGGYYSVKSEGSTRCLDVAGGSTADGGKLHQWDCNAGNINQSWKLEDRGSGWFQLVSRKSEKCVDVENSGTGNSAKIFQKNCDTTKQSQQLRFR